MNIKTIVRKAKKCGLLVEIEEDEDIGTVYKLFDKEGLKIAESNSKRMINKAFDDGVFSEFAF